MQTYNMKSSNLSVIAALRGEAAWLCLMCCNSDILFNTIVVHWVTSKDPQSYIVSVAPLSSLDGRPGMHTGNGRGLSGNKIKDMPGVLPKAHIVTNISARHHDAEHGEGPSIVAAEFDETRRDRSDSFPLGTIQVQTEHMREEWTERGSGRKSDCDAESSEFVDHGSTKELAHQRD